METYILASLSHPLSFACPYTHISGSLHLPLPPYAFSVAPILSRQT